MKKVAFWEEKTLAEMTRQEWESLCDGCAKCCLHKLEDEDSGEIYYTDIACRYLDDHNCSCGDYANRSTLVPNCLTLTPQNVYEYDWLPHTCAYRLLAEGQPLYDWHPLISGDRESVHKASMSIRHRSVSDDKVDEEDWEEHIVHWVL